MNKHKKQISSFLNKNIKKLALPFIKLFKNQNINESALNKIKVLPKTKKTDEKTDISYDSTESKPTILNNSLSFGSPPVKLLPKQEKQSDKKTDLPTKKVFFGQTNSKLNKTIETLPKTDVKGVNLISNMLFFGKVKPVITENEKNNEQTAKNKNIVTKKIEFAKKIENFEKLKAKLEPNAKIAGGKDGAKVVVLKNLNTIGSKEAAVVGENGPEKIIQSTGVVLPMKQNLKQTKPSVFAINYQKGNSTLPIKTTTQLQKDNSTLPIKTTQPQKDNSTLPIKTTQPQKDNSTLSIKPVNVKQSTGEKMTFLKEILPKQISITFGKPTNISLKNTKTKQNDNFVGKPVKLGKIPSNIGLLDSEIEMEQQEKEHILELAENKKISNTIQKLPDGRTIIKLPGYEEGRGSQSSASGSSGGGNVSSMFGNLVGGIGKIATTAFKASPLGMAASAASSVVSSLMGNDDKKEDSAKVMTTQGNNFSPTNITNVSYQYDIYRKTADDSFMLPNFRREYG